MIDSPATDPAVALLTARGVKKSYGGVQALKGVDFEIFPGEVHGLCGENGSGKSTLLKILSAQIPLDAGTISIDGSEVSFRSPLESLSSGIATVTQERSLVPELTVAENVMLGHNKARRIWGIDWQGTRRKASSILNKLNVECDVTAYVSHIAPGQAQLVEIGRAISQEMRVLILDEPTSSLSTHEVGSLFQAIRRLRESGVAVIFISHRMQEVFDICDRITILRDGNLVSTGPIGNYTADSIVADMLGRELSAFHGDPEHNEHPNPILELKGLTLSRHYSDVSFSLGQGEILGIAGLVGAGHSELVETLFGVHPQHEGGIAKGGSHVDLRDPPSAMRSGIAFVPADRKTNGLVLEMSVLENVIMASTSLRARAKNPRPPDAVAFVKECVDRFNIITPSLDTPVVRLSGGNQQKVLLSKWIGTRPDILVLDEPTRGVDVGAKTEIYRILLQQREQGMSIIVSSSEVPELLTLCDRIVVMHRGEVSGVVSRSNADEEIILRLAMGHE